ncbi:hypothetical protein PNOK_0779800 [Pyrrhoderma noxium]|uniref:Uncharacterized protein n=1 Tax=Pyrrhoderma noxium TaxID=2282107 RepID=A0A286U9D1_9AGAM|nr:hypothetical protein PNOK_0779800 [Pyrrhoderma noxium]
MSSTPTKCLPSVEDYISKLKEKRDKQTQDSSAYRKWNRYVKRAQGQGVTAESIKAMLDADYIRIDEFIEQTGQGTMRGRTRFPKNLTTVEQYITELEKFKNRQRPRRGAYYHWDHLVKIAKEDGATVGSIEEAMKKANEDKVAREKKRLGGEDSGSEASPSTTAAAASSSQVMISVTPDTYGRSQSVPARVSVGVSSGGSSTKTGAPPQTSTTKATTAPTSKTQPKPSAPVTSTISHSHSSSNSSSISSTRQQKKVVESDRQRPKTPTKDTVSASTSQTSSRKTITSPITTRTSHTISIPSDQRIASPSPFNSPQKRKLSLSSERTSISNRSNQSKQLNEDRCGTPGKDE